LKDGERHRTRRKEIASWADEVEARLDDDRKSLSSEIDGRQSLRKDDGRGATQYSRQDRRKISFTCVCCCYCLPCFDAVGSAARRASGL